MNDLSLYILDTAMNSVRAGAMHIDIGITETEDAYTLTVKDDGVGMTEEEVRRATDPFFTTRTTRDVGLGLPFLASLAEETGGSLDITSTPIGTDAPHGTVVRAVIGKKSIDCPPLGDTVATVITLIEGSPEREFTFTHKTEKGTVHLSTEETRAALDEIPLTAPEVLRFLEQQLYRDYRDLKGSSFGQHE